MTDEKPKEEKVEKNVEEPKIEEKEQPKEETSKEEKPVEEKKEEPKKEEKPKEKPKKVVKPVKKEHRLKTTSEEKNHLMKRTDYIINVVHSSQATPTRTVLVKEIAKLLKIKEDVILVEKIFSERGKAESIVKVYVYKDKKDIPKHKLDKLAKRASKNKGAEQPAPAEKPAEAPKEEAKPEEKVEHPK